MTDYFSGVCDDCSKCDADGNCSGCGPSGEECGPLWVKLVGPIHQKDSVRLFPLIDSKIRCLRAPSFALADTAEAMIGQVGTLLAHYPADPREPDDDDMIGIQYPVTPYSDNCIALPLSERGHSWEDYDG